MKRLPLLTLVVLLSLGLALLPACACGPGGQPDCLEDCIKVSVMVKTDDGSGSGVVTRNGEYAFCWTDFHVVEDCQVVRTVVDVKTGQPKVEVTYRDCQVGQEEFDGGRKVGEVWYLARVIRANKDEDLALLLLHKKNWPAKGATFSPADYIPRSGEEIYHVGSMTGQAGCNTSTLGIFSVAGRLRRDFTHTDTDRPLVYDQVSTTALPGSSGGGCFSRKTGQCYGLVTEFVEARSYGTFCMTPSRRLRAFARRTECDWAVDPCVKLPGADELQRQMTEGYVRVPDDWPKK